MLMWSKTIQLRFDFLTRIKRELQNEGCRVEQSIL